LRKSISCGQRGQKWYIDRVCRITIQSVPLRQRAMLGGILTCLEGIAIAGAPLLGGVITEKWSWRGCFWINLPVGFITVFAVLVFFTNPQVDTANQRMTLKQKLGKMDIPSTVIFVPSIVCLLLALQWGGSMYGWKNARIIGLFVVFAALLAVFTWVQWRKGDEALLPARIITNRSILAGMLFSSCNNSATSIVEYYVSPSFSASVEKLTFPRRCQSTSKPSARSQPLSPESSSYPS